MPIAHAAGYRECMSGSHKASVASLPPRFARAARSIAARLREAGHEAWLVGGCVRDLCMGRIPHDVDIATDATPDRIEALFESTIGVGRAFGTMIVLHREQAEAGEIAPASAGGAEDSSARQVELAIEVTSYRSEGAYSDARRPDAVTYVSSAEIDASRRDFTCNALYLDPLDDRIFDPVGGLRDIEARLLRCVGDAAERFEEDGLRLIRMARFQARLDFEAAPGLHAVARSRRHALRGVSVERVLAELEKIFRGPRSARAIEILAECELLDACLPEEWRALAGEGWSTRLEHLRRLPQPAGLVRGLATLFSPGVGGGSTREACAASLLEKLRPSKATLKAVQAIWRAESELEALLAGSASRSRRVRLVREPSWTDALCVRAARLEAEGRATTELEALADWARGLSLAQLRPPALLRSSDLAETELARGPRWGELLAEAEERQLDEEFPDREAALDWLRKRAAEFR